MPIVYGGADGMTETVRGIMLMCESCGSTALTNDIDVDMDWSGGSSCPNCGEDYATCRGCEDTIDLTDLSRHIIYVDLDVRCVKCGSTTSFRLYDSGDE